jgi:hypothetical protein
MKRAIIAERRGAVASSTPSPPNPPLEGEGFKGARRLTSPNYRWPKVVLVLLGLSTTAAHADAVLEYSGSDADCHADFVRVAVQGLSMRIDSAPPAQDMSMVYDAAEKVGVALDHKRKQFFELEFDDDAIDFQGDVMKSTSNMVDRKTEQLQKQLPPGAMQPGASGMPQVDPKLMEQMMQQNMEHMTKEQRAQMEAAMKNMRASGYFGPQSEPVIEATGEKREVGGLACTVERVSQDGQLLREDCRTSLDAIGLDPADVKRMLRVIVRMQKYSSAVTANLRLIKNVNSVRRDNVDPQHPLVERRCFEQGKPTGDVTLRVRSESVPADWFVTPADYARMDMGMRGH